MASALPGIPKPLSVIRESDRAYAKRACPPSSITSSIFDGREAIVDQMSVLRAVAGASETEEELKYLLLVPFLEQRSKTHTAPPSLVGTSRYIFHAMFLRPVLISYLCGRFPQFLGPGKCVYSVRRKFHRDAR